MTTTFAGPQLRGMTPAGPLIPELGVSLLAGRTADPARVLDEAVAAERLGLSAVWIAERFDTKELAVLCAAMAARTQHIRLGFGSLAVGSRNPVYAAATATTFQGLFGDRLMLGLARGLGAVLLNQGMTVPTMKWLRGLRRHPARALRRRGGHLRRPGGDVPAGAPGGPSAAAAADYVELQLGARPQGARPDSP